MIRYTLRCERKHTFESWFQDSSTYDAQVARKLVNCPVCSSVKIEKAIMVKQRAYAQFLRENEPLTTEQLKAQRACPLRLPAFLW